ncbi:hypothetical protein N7528_005028 [Penicillium herquei]|nr:hypothetical protein N7528_005028 [Penicillium herquei]
MSPRTIWIDALFIDQADKSELSHQMSFMRDIYSRASRVFIWLGPAAENSDAVMDYIGTLNGEPDLLEHKKWVYADTDLWNWDTCKPWWPLPVSSQSIDAFSVGCGFLGFGSDRKQLPTGRRLFSAGGKKEGFAKNALSDHALTSALLVLNIQSYTYGDVPALLLDILRDITFCGAKDPRDRIYAVQTLAQDEDLHKLMLLPDYDDGVPTVYTKLAERYLEAQGPFVLCWAGRYHQYILELPSWVPDWTMVNIELPSINFKASGDSQECCKVHTEDELRILFAYGGTVSSVCALTDLPAIPGAYRGRMGEHSVFELFRKHIEACLELIEANESRARMKYNKRDSWRVLVADNDRDWSGLPKDYGEGLAMFPAWLATFQEQQTPSTIPSEYKELIETMHIRGAFLRRRFAIDSKGNMCFVPWTTTVGDVIVILSGLTMPLVARSSQKGRPEIIGECYAHGCKDGEVWKDNFASEDQIVEIVSHLSVAAAVS